MSAAPKRGSVHPIGAAWLSRAAMRIETASTDELPALVGEIVADLQRLRARGTLAAGAVPLRLAAAMRRRRVAVDLAAQRRNDVATAGQYERANVENNNVCSATAADLDLRRGEVQRHGGQTPRDVADHNIPTAADLGLRRDQIFEARQLRSTAPAPGQRLRFDAVDGRSCRPADDARLRASGGFVKNPPEHGARLRASGGFFTNPPEST